MTEERDLSERLKEMCDEAAQLRETAGQSSTEETLTDLHDRLVRTRQAEDRIEAILGSLIRMRGLGRRAVREAKDDLEDAQGEVIRKSKAAEFSTAREREAGYELETLAQRRRLRTMERTLGNIEMAHEFVALLHRGIDGARRDIDLRVRIVTIESRLER